MEKFISNSEEKTYEFGYQIGKRLEKGDIICLSGDLGAGKTTLTKAIAKALEVDEYVTSPTFTIINEYNGRIPLYHFDVYRINDIEEMEELGYEEYFFGQGVCIVEWADLIKEIIPPKSIWIKITRSKKENERIFEISNCNIE